MAGAYKLAVVVVPIHATAEVGAGRGKNIGNTIGGNTYKEFQYFRLFTPSVLQRSFVLNQLVYFPVGSEVAKVHRMCRPNATKRIKGKYGRESSEEGCPSSGQCDTNDGKGFTSRDIFVHVSRSTSSNVLKENLSRPSSSRER